MRNHITKLKLESAKQRRHRTTQTIRLPFTSATSRLAAADSHELSSTFSKVVLQYMTATLQLNPGLDGNLFLSSISNKKNLTSLTTSSFQATTYNETTVIYGDSADRYLHYYPSSISKLGISRLSLSLESQHSI